MVPDDRHSVLYVEDDVMLRRRVATYLEDHGYAVTQVHTLGMARDLLGAHHFDIVLLDLILRNEDGLDLAKEIAQDGGPAIIVTSARTEEADRIMTLELAADDYLTKPYVFRELLARIRAVSRRGLPAMRHVPRRGSAHFGHWTFDELAHQLRDDCGEIVPLTHGELDLLRAFVHQPGRALQRHELLGLTQGDDSRVFGRTVDVLVGRLRRKLTGPDGARAIETVRGCGYRFALDVQWNQPTVS